MTAEQMAHKMGYSYEYVKGDCSEDTIQCIDLKKTRLLLERPTPEIQFNLISRLIVINNLTFITQDIFKFMVKQVEELEWEEYEIERD